MGNAVHTTQNIPPQPSDITPVNPSVEPNVIPNPQQRYLGGRVLQSQPITRSNHRSFQRFWQYDMNIADGTARNITLHNEL